MKHTVYLLVTLIFIVSCRHAKEASVAGSILLSAAVESGVPALASGKVNSSSTTFVAGDEVGLYFTEQGLDLAPQGNQTDNHKFAYNGSAWSSDLLANPFTGSKVAAYGYYPYDANQTDATRIIYTPKPDQSAGITPDSYFLRGVTTSGNLITPSTDGSNPTAIDLTFTNCLTKLVADVALSWADTEPNITVNDVYAISQPASGRFNLQTNLWTVSESTKEIKMYKNADGKYECLTIPSSFPTSTPLFRIEHSGGNYEYYVDKSGGLTLAPNSVHTFSVSNPRLYCLTEFEFEVGGGMIMANIVTNMTEPWTLTVTRGAEWLSVNNGNEVTAAVNDTKLSRFGLLTLSNGVYSYEVLVFQK